MWLQLESSWSLVHRGDVPQVIREGFCTPHVRQLLYELMGKAGGRFNLFSEVDPARLRTDSFKENGAAEGQHSQQLVGSDPQGKGVWVAYQQYPLFAFYLSLF